MFLRLGLPFTLTRHENGATPRRTVDVCSVYRVKSQYTKREFLTSVGLGEYIYVICRLGGPYSEKLCPRSQFFTIRTDLEPVNNLVIFSKLSNEKETEKKSRKHYCDRGQR